MASSGSPKRSLLPAIAESVFVLLRCESLKFPESDIILAGAEASSQCEAALVVIYGHLPQRRLLRSHVDIQAR